MADWIANGETASSIRAKLNMTTVTAATDIADADYIQYYDTSATTMKKSLWSNIKSVLKTYFDTLYCPIMVTSYGTSGYVKIGSLYIQWGTGSYADGGTVVTLPIAFPNSCLSVTASATESYDISERIYAVSKTTITIGYHTVGSGYGTKTIRWIAVGY